MQGKLIDFGLTLQSVEDVKIFFGDYDGIQRYDRFKYPVSKKLIAIQQAQKWFPKELNYSKDKASMATMGSGMKKLYQYNLGFQTVADSLANRFLDNIYSTLITSPEWENVIKWQSNFELLHSESYSHTVREVEPDAELFFDEVLAVPEIQARLQHEVEIFSDLERRLEEVADDELEKMFIILEATLAQYVLENIRFIISFLYTFKINKMTENGILGTANSIGLILNDETIHAIIFMHIIKILKKEKSEGFTECFKPGPNRDRFVAILKNLYTTVIDSEMEWFEFLSSIEDIDGMTTKSTREFLHFYANQSLRRIGEDELFDSVDDTQELVMFFEEARNINGKKVLAQENDLLSYSIGALADKNPNHDEDYKKMLENKMEEMELG